MCDRVCHSIFLLDDYLPQCCRLYGVTCSQIYNYFVRRFQDSVSLKWTVCISRKAPRYSDHNVHASRSCSSGMFSSLGLSCSLLISTSRVLDTFDAILNSHFLYYYLVTNHADPTAVEKLVWSVIVSSTNCPWLLSIFSFGLLPDTCRNHSRFIYNELRVISDGPQCFSNFIVRGLYARRVFSREAISYCVPSISHNVRFIVSGGNWQIVVLIVSYLVPGHWPQFWSRWLCRLWTLVRSYSSGNPMI